MRAQRAEVCIKRLGACWSARFKAVGLSSTLMESYLYVAGRGTPYLYYSTTAAGFQPVFFIFSSGGQNFRKKVCNYEQTEEKHF
jgi:hypothetical protein